MSRLFEGREKLTLYVKPETDAEMRRQVQAVRSRTGKPFTPGRLLDRKFKPKSEKVA